MKTPDEIKLFWLEPTKRAQRVIRRYAGVQAKERKCPGPTGYHNARVVLGVDVAVFAEDGRTIASLPDLPSSDERWPTKCDDCDFEFDDENKHHHRQHGQELLLSRSDGGADVTTGAAPLGAMWDAWWYGKQSRGTDGICLVLKTPGGDWLVDSKCNNCKAPKDLVHQCWPRTGNPKDPRGSPPLNVGSNGGCKVGAGSIKMKKYHGFLNKGYLRTKRQ